MSADDIAFIAIPWVVIGIIICAAISEDTDVESRHFVMGFFWPLTLAVFLIVGPFVAIYFSIKACLGMFKP